MPYIGDPSYSPPGTISSGSPQAAEIAKALMARGQGASPQTQRFLYSMQAMPWNYEGILRVYAEKYGPEAAKTLAARMPQMSLPELKQLDAQMQEAGRQDDMMRDMLMRGLGGPR